METWPLRASLSPVGDIDSHRNRRTKIEVLLLCIVMVFVGILRFYNLADQGFMVGDDGGYVVAAKRIIEGAYESAEMYHVRPGFIMIGHSFNRPGFIALVLLATRLVGLSPMAGAGVSAVFGLLTVGLVYAITRQLVDRRAALLATALLATSTWHIFQSRVGLSNATATFFWTLGLYLWLRFHQDRRTLWIPLAAGLSFGYAFTCHYGLLLFLGVGSLIEAWLAIQSRAYRGTFLLGIGLLLPLYGFYAVGGYWPWGEILRLSQVDQSAPDLFHYFKLLWHYETLPFTVLTVLGVWPVVKMLRPRSLSPVGPLVLLTVTSLLLLSLQAASGNARPRLMTPLLPLMAMLAGCGATSVLTRLQGSARFRQAGLALWWAAPALILVSGTYANWGFFSWRSGYAEAAAYLQAHYPNRQSVCNGSWSVCEFYRLGPQVMNTRELQAVIPPPEVLFAHGLDSTWESRMASVPLGRPVAEFPNIVELDPRIAEETGGDAAVSRQALGVIRIYDLRRQQ